MTPGANKVVAGCAASAALIAFVAGYLIGRGTQATDASEGKEASTPEEKVVSIDAEVTARLSDSMSRVAKLERALSEISLPEETGGEGAGYCVTVVTSGGVSLLARNDSQRLRIASLTKLYTTTSAMLAFGPEFRFETKVVIPASDTNPQSFVNEAYFVGGGDPYLVSSEFEEFWRRESEDGPATRLEDLADQVAGAGIRSIETLYVDASLFDPALYPPEVPASLIEQKLLPPVSALSVNRNLAAWGNSIARAEFSSDPAGEAGARLALALKKRGVTVGKVAKKVAPSGGERSRVFVVKSARLADIVAFINSRSDNFGAEMLAKRVGASSGAAGSWSAFWPQASEVLRRYGIELASTELRDGSGLSGNSSSCSDVARLLGSLARMPEGSVIAGGLATPGKPGTLHARFTGIPGAERLKAKTGSLKDVSALAGLVDAENLSAVIFSVLINGSNASERRSQVEEPVVRTLISATN